jgi:phosphate transport system substrate-binding protein
VVGSIGYVSPDFVQPVDKTGPQTANLQTYATFSAGGTPLYVAPTPGNATAAMATTKPPTFTKANPLNWGAVSPTPTAAHAYPASGFSFIDLYTCYSSPAVVTALVSTTAKKFGYLTWYYGSTTVNQGVPAAILGKDGFAPVPPAWSSLINTLLTSSTLGINTPGKGACTKIAKGA